MPTVIQDVEFQNEILDDIENNLNEGITRQLICAPCGAGKTVLITKVVRFALEDDLRTLIVFNKEALLPQTLEKLESDGLDIENCWIIAGGYKKQNPDAKIWIASQQALARRTFWHCLPKKHAIDIVCLDEAHEVAFSKPGTKLCAEEDRFGLVLGFTATPYRLARSQGMSQRFQRAVCGPVPQKLIELGWLSPVKTFVMLDPSASPDLSKVGTKGGDFVDADLAVACDKEALIEHAIDSWQKLSGGDKRTLVFGVNIQHASNLHAAFSARGVSSVLVTGSTPKAERHEIYAKFKAGEILVLCSVDVVSVGFDAVEAEVALVCRPTKSKAKAWQITGRVGRRSPHTGKTCGIVIDQAGNALRLGTAEMLSQYEMDEPAEIKSKDSGAPSKVCPECGQVHTNFATKCECGYEFPRADRLEQGGEMVELSLLSRMQRMEDQRLKTLRKYAKTAFTRGLAPGWAAVKFKEQFGGWPSNDIRQHATFPAPTESDAKAYLQYLAKIAAKKDFDRAWVFQQFEFEFGTTFLARDVIQNDRLLQLLPIFRGKGTALELLRAS